MLHGRRLLVAVLLGVAFLGAAINAIGPFGAHPALAYPQFLADIEAGRVDQIVRWRDRLEVTERLEAFLVVVPEGSDLNLDLAQARAAGGVGMRTDDGDAPRPYSPDTGAWPPGPRTSWAPAVEHSSEGGATHEPDRR